MPTLWFSRDGEGPYAQRGLGIEISLTQATALCASTQIHYCGVHPPRINPETPSRMVKNVIIEIGRNNASNIVFQDRGFYWLVGAKSNDVKRALDQLTM